MNSTNSTNHEFVKTHLLESANTKRRLAEEGLAPIIEAAKLIAASFNSGSKLLLCGNGGSAADCQHLAAEFVNRLTSNFERQGLPALALTTDTSFLTSYANDYSFDDIFKRQVETFGKKGDVLLCITTSGNSVNLLQAASAARSLNMKTISLMGEAGKLLHHSDVVISVPSTNIQYIQEAHLAIEHILCGLVERLLFDKSNI